MYLNRHDYNVERDPDAELRRIIERCLTRNARKATLEKRGAIQIQREEIQRLREALVSEPWTLALEDELGDLRYRLSKILRELYQAHLSGVERNEVIERSRDLQDRVADSVIASENRLTAQERDRWRKETEQSLSEQEVVEKEETKAKEGRHEADKKPKH